MMLTPIPDVAVAVSAPRIAAIEYPLGRTLGQPGDSAGQMAVLQALQNIQIPGSVVHLPFEWPEAKVHNEAPITPPIVEYIQHHLWQLPRLLKRDVPE